MLPKDSVIAIAKNAFVYGAPLFLIDVTKKKTTNVEVPVLGLAAPINQLTISTSFPPQNETMVVRPNADTYYTMGFLDLGKGAMVLTLPVTNDNYFMFPMLDAYTNVFVSPGTRTGVKKGGAFLITGPNWKDSVPAGMKQIKSPTSTVWVIGRFQVNSEKQGAQVVVPLEKKVSIIPLSAYGKPYTEPKGIVDPNISKELPNDQLANIPIDSFFNYINQLMVTNPPSDADAPAMEMFAKIGVGPGLKFDLNSFDTATQATLKEIPRMVIAHIYEVLKSGVVKPVNGWSVAFKGFGNAGTDYDLRMMVAFLGLGANIPEDAIYPTSALDSAGNPYSGTNKYVIHFAKGQTPPVNAFWSLTMYSAEGYFIANPINRYAIGDRNPLKYNADGSLDIYFQNASPGKDKENNWLPAPTGPFNLCLRLYWPKQEVVTGKWTPPPVKKM
jgi:DNA sulfur modification protein DndE